ncbi:MAG TPA: xanthine dehydrogenase family protein subunit M [Candidatus Saccharimonadales bacterium]|nr:xanthine dehydrogenase family protein subunit M [Candidatus Saccharimonadales bacterium]
MRPFRYLACASVEEACAALRAHAGRARVLAGGTDLLLELRRGDGPAPEVMVDISRLEELRGIVAGNGTLRLGPLARHAELAASEPVRRRAGLLAAAAGAVGSPQVRNRGTVGGNVMNAATCADTVPPLVALGARLTLRSAGGSRELDIADFFERPYVTRARPDELLVAIEFPALPPCARSAFVKLGRRNALSIARLSVAAVVDRDASGRITDARIVPGAALPVWKRAREAEAMLVGQAPSEALFAAAGRRTAELMIGETGRRWSSEYKEPVLAVLVRRALEACC